PIQEPVSVETIREDGTYTSKEEVALYIHTYGKLPSNYITKNEAKKKGWEASKGNLNKVCPGFSIGGDRFSNYEGYLPEKEGRKYYECDIDYQSGTRNGKRIIYSNDGLIYYTGDHYNTFELLYGEP
ncbi:MAG: ribonuclease, partial [Erysipelotrichaceae bacterium]|nr:ribonuclease [Erysipelotrichaceae bacterium]